MRTGGVAVTRLVLVLLAGCNLVFDIGETEPRMEEMPADGDLDGVPDALDNCVAIANEVQRDIDDDGLGDACDNCPHITNRDQSSVGDDDPVGDACDPHPDEKGDCLILLDMFTDPAAFTSHWSVTTDGTPPGIDVVAGAATLTPMDTDEVAMLALDNAGVQLAGVFETHVRARTRVASGGLYAVSNHIPAVGVEPGYGCGLYWYATSKAVWSNASSAAPGSGVSYPSPFSSAPVDDLALLRLNTPSSSESTMVYCRVDYGLALSTTRVSAPPAQQPSRTMGGAGVVVAVDPVTIESVALYSVLDGACPAPIYR